VRFKKEVELFGLALDQVPQLRPVYLVWRADGFPERTFSRKRSHGLVT
jgi:hypothetical protein